MEENLWSISIDPDESMREYVLLPGGRTVRVRGLQTHGESHSRVEAGAQHAVRDEALAAGHEPLQCVEQDPLHLAREIRPVPRRSPGHARRRRRGRPADRRLRARPAGAALQRAPPVPAPRRARRLRAARRLDPAGRRVPRVPGDGHGRDPPRHRLPEHPVRPGRPARRAARRDDGLVQRQLRGGAQAGRDRGAVPVQDAQAGARPVQAPPLDAAVRRRFEQEFAPDVRTLSGLLGRDLESEWFGVRAS